MSDPFPSGCALDCTCKRAACIQVKTIKCIRNYYGFSAYFAFTTGFEVQDSGVHPSGIVSAADITSRFTQGVFMRAWSTRHAIQRQKDGSITEDQFQTVDQKNQVPTVTNLNPANKFFSDAWGDNHDQGQICGGFVNGTDYPLYPAVILEWSITGYEHYDNPDCPLAGGDVEKHKLTMSLSGEINPDNKIQSLEDAVDNDSLFEKFNWGQMYNVSFNDTAPPPGFITWAGVDTSAIDFSSYDGSLKPNGIIGGAPVAASFAFIGRANQPSSGGVVTWGISMAKSEVLHSGTYILVTSVFTTNLGEIEPRLEREGVGDGSTPIIIPIPKYGAFTAAQRAAGRVGSITRFFPCSWEQYKLENGITG